ncbi:hypothetical protein D3C75_1036370 [compost metagenome]
MGQAQVLVQAPLKPLAVHRLLGHGAVGQLPAHDFAEQVVLGGEMVIEGPAGQADGLHQPGHAGGIEAPALGQGAAAFQQFLPGLFFVGGGVAHADLLLVTGLTKPES